MDGSMTMLTAAAALAVTSTLAWKHSNPYNPKFPLGRDIEFNNSALIRTKKSLTSECPTCRRLPFCPICSQSRAESKDGKCPAHITSEEIILNINQFYLDLSNQNQPAV